MELVLQLYHVPGKFLQSAKEFGCDTIMCVVIYI